MVRSVLSRSFVPTSLLMYILKIARYLLKRVLSKAIPKHLMNYALMRNQFKTLICLGLPNISKNL